MTDHINSLQKSHKEIITLLERFYPANFFLGEKGSGSFAQLLESPQFRFLQEQSPAAFCILNYQEMRYDYFSENIKGLLGYEASRYTQPDGFEFALSTFHPSHLAVFSGKIVPKIIEYYNEFSAEDQVKTLRFTLTFLCRNANNEYIWCMQQISVLETDAQGLPLYSLVFLSNITNIKKDEQLDFIISQKNADGIYAPILATTMLDQKDFTFLSKRELEVLTLISKGLSTSEIAEILNISTETISSHRKNMLVKSKAKNTAELLNLAIKKGFL